MLLLVFLVCVRPSRYDALPIAIQRAHYAADGAAFAEPLSDEESLSAGEEEDADTALANAVQRAAADAEEAAATGNAIAAASVKQEPLVKIEERVLPRAPKRVASESSNGNGNGNARGSSHNSRPASNGDSGGAGSGGGKKIKLEQPSVKLEDPR